MFAAPFGDYLSERVEGILGTWTPRDFSFGFILRDLGQTIKLELLRFGIKLAWLAPLFLVSVLIPIIGHLLYVLLGGYLLSKFIGMDYIDWCAARRGWSWQERLLFAKQHRFALAGLGSGVMLSYFVPIMFVLVWPAAVAGGVRLFTDLLRKGGAGNLPSRPLVEKEEQKSKVSTLRNG